MVGQLRSWMRWLVVLGALLVASSALAARAELSLDTRELSVGQVVGLKVRVVDGNPTAVPAITAPEGLALRYLHQSNSTLSVNFKVTRVVEFNYRLEAVSEGTYTLGPAVVQLGTDTISTRALTLAVGPRPSASSAPLVAEATFFPDQAWQGQVVVYRYRLLQRIDVARTNWSIHPFDGLRPPRDGDRPRNKYLVEDAVGQQLVDETWIPLIASRSGDLTQPAAAVTAHVPVRSRDDRFDPFGHFTRTRPEGISTGEVPLMVRPLPTPPEGFSGLVGDFQFTSRVDRTECKVGESVTWKVEVAGDGTLESFDLPPMPDLQGARVYDSSPSAGAHVENGRYRAEAVLTRVIVPTEAGNLELPALEFSTFSPSTEAYVSHRLEVPPLVVQPGAEGDGQVESFGSRLMGSPEPEAIMEHDIRPVKPAGPAYSAPLDRALPVILGLAAAPGVLGLGWLGWTRVRRRREQRRREQAQDLSPTQQLRALPTEREARLAALDAALRDALARRSTPLEPSLTDEVEALRRALERARFAEGALLPDEERRLLALIRELEP